ncbi:pyridoxamine 5'-phosphate oxidase [Candidatus Chloroploca sp. Khr17]|uniref:pyridoxamine 5'-phosphate oxidase n=1 Tax=Candidatus Chloroploca sp. Khr17 TaxID=2496869 RepID=UPI00101E0B40|nr:pyridoxamine 5'-phosphate oxidase [Candidatus Chloroploca sp. Khr17]
MQELRKEYTLRGLAEHEVAADPITQFQRWFDDAIASGLREPNAMTLATVDRDGRPSARIVLMKSFDQAGFTFFTNYASRKAQALDASGLAALIFYWTDLERQIRIEGTVTRLDSAASDAYFAERPLAARLGAWASSQSQVVADRAELEARFNAVAQQFHTQDPPRPSFWGGYRVTPDRLEFWQGRPSRLHDRILYQRIAQGWQIVRLAP